MKIKYIHASAPDIVKTYDTEKAFKNLPPIFKQEKTQDIFDAQELILLERDAQRGLILSYKAEQS